MKLGWKRLLKLADILDVADAEHKKRGEPQYNQGYYQHECGSPACALGHYAASAYGRRRGWTLERDLPSRNGDCFAERSEFGINENEEIELFEVDGCGNARTAKQAARYIRQFVKRKQAES